MKKSMEDQVLAAFEGITGGLTAREIVARIVEPTPKNYERWRKAISRVTAFGQIQVIAKIDKAKVYAVKKEITPIDPNFLPMGLMP